MPKPKMMTKSVRSGVYGLATSARCWISLSTTAVLLNASQSDGRTRIISAPSVIATDNIAASITVGAMSVT